MRAIFRWREFVKRKMRTVFDATMKDAAFLAEKMKKSITPPSSGKMQDVVARLYATPNEFVGRVPRW